jgi:NADPH-dependent 2,4-dienoyl-CoA reductase/sulfur reductase-like enzyme
MTTSSKYLIVGGGIAADAAVRGIRSLDREGRITVLSSELHAPYDRPPLSKGLWRGKPIRSIWRNTEEKGIDLRLGISAMGGDLASHRIVDSVGEVHVFEKLLLATGGVPRRLPSAAPYVVYLRTLDDYYSIRAHADQKREFIVIGGGFIGSEIAAALAAQACRVTILFPESGIGARMFPASLSEFLNDYYRDCGVTVLPFEKVSSVARTGDRLQVITASGKMLRADSVIAGLGVAPQTGLASALGLAVGDGIEVDKHLRTSAPDIYAAGDVANFHSQALGYRLRVEHEDNAIAMGTVAGHNMAGHLEQYDHVPFFYSDLFDLGYEAVGRLSGDMEVVEAWEEPLRKGVIYYLLEDRIQGVLLWNTWNQVDSARELLGRKFRPTYVAGHKAPVAGGGGNAFRRRIRSRHSRPGGAGRRGRDTYSGIAVAMRLTQHPCVTPPGK